MSELFCEQFGLEPPAMLEKLKTYGVAVGAVTMGADGLIYYSHEGPTTEMEALPVPADRVIDTNGAGDIFHGAYVASMIQSHSRTWDEHFRFARAASGYAVQYLGNEESIPTLADIDQVRNEFEPVIA